MKGRREYMKILGHAVFGLAILMIGYDFAAVDGGMARRLSLTGAGVIPFIPWLAASIYILIVGVARKVSKQWIAVCGNVGAYILAAVCTTYPNWLFERYSQKIEIGPLAKRGEMFLPADEITMFEHKFNTPTIQYSSSSGGPWLVVPRNKFSDAMVSFLNDQAAEKNGPSAHRTENPIAAPR